MNKFNECSKKFSVGNLLRIVPKKREGSKLPILMEYRSEPGRFELAPFKELWLVGRTVYCLVLAPERVRMYEGTTGPVVLASSKYIKEPFNKEYLFDTAPVLMNGKIYYYAINMPTCRHEIWSNHDIFVES